jgi:hypothetical protein
MVEEFCCVLCVCSLGDDVSVAFVVTLCFKINTDDYGF